MPELLTSVATRFAGIAGTSVGTSWLTTTLTRYMSAPSATSSSRDAPVPGVAVVIVASGGRIAPSRPSGSPYPK
jgi:hypothetical protein